MSETRTLIGKVVKILPTQTFDSGFTKRQIVIEEPADNPDYNQQIAVTFIKDKCGILDQFQPGQEVMINFNLRGNEWNGKYFTELQGWRIGAAASKPVPQQEAAPAAPLPF